MKVCLARTVGILCVAGGVAVIGCNATFPGSPTSSTAPIATSGPTTQATRIRGTVLSGASVAIRSAHSVHASAAPTSKPAAGVHVSLVGSGRSATTDAQGHFTLNNAPLGKNRLQFDGQNSHRSLDVDLHQGKELNLAIELSEEDVNLVCEIEIEESEGSNNDGEDTPTGSTGNVCDQSDQNDGLHLTRARP